MSGMRCDLANMARQAADALRHTRAADGPTYAASLEQLAEHVMAVRADPKLLPEFCRLYILPGSVP